MNPATGRYDRLEAVIHLSVEDRSRELVRYISFCGCWNGECERLVSNAIFHEVDKQREAIIDICERELEQIEKEKFRDEWPAAAKVLLDARRDGVESILYAIRDEIEAGATHPG